MLKLKCVQEGVETREQMERVKALGCDTIQGFYYARPMTYDEYVQWYAKRTR